MIEKLPIVKRVAVKLSSFKNIMTIWAMVVFTYMVVTTATPLWGIFLGMAAGINGFQNLVQKYVESKKI